MTIKMASFSTAISFAFSVLLAYVMSRRNVPGKRVIDSLLPHMSGRKNTALAMPTAQKALALSESNEEGPESDCFPGLES